LIKKNCDPAMRPHLTLFFIALSLAILTTACSSAQAAPARITPATGRGGLVGQVADTAEQWPDQSLNVYAAAYFADDNDPGGIFSLDPGLCPQAELERGGAFQLNDVKPGSYVLVVGPSAEEARLVVDAQQKARVFEVKPGQVLELGQLKLAE
jgi:hypothetical protein